MLLAAVGAAIVAPAAEGATRHVAPGASGPEPCAAAAPCGLKDAIERSGIGTGDVVSLAAGTYVQESEVALFATDVTVAGPPAGTGTARIEMRGGSWFSAVGPGARLQDLTVVGSDAISYTLNVQSARAVLERIRVYGQGVTPGALLLSTGAVVRDSVAWSDGEIAIATRAGTGQTAPIDLVNVTAGSSRLALLASGGFVGAGGALNVRLTNTLLHHDRPDPGEYALVAASDVGPTGRPVSVSVAASTVPSLSIEGSASYVPGGGILSTPALLANVAALDLRQAPGSSTIDAGVDAAPVALGTVDIDGRPRKLGVAVDIGAHEHGEIPGPGPGPGGGGGGTGGSGGAGGGGTGPGGGGGAATTPKPDRTAPRLAGLRSSKRTLTVRVSEAATVRFRLDRCTTRRVAAKTGRKARKRTTCKRAATMTARTTRAGTVRRSVPKRLRAGRYRVKVQATDRAGNRSRTSTRTVRVARAGKR